MLTTEKIKINILCFTQNLKRNYHIKKNLNIPLFNYNCIHTNFEIIRVLNTSTIYIKNVHVKRSV